MNKEKQKQLLIDIMEADSKDGLYKHKTAVEWLIEQLQAPCRGIPSHIIEQAKQMEKEQIVKARIDGDENHTLVGNKRKEYAEQYYNETYKK